MAGRIRVPSAAMTSGMEDVQVMAEAVHALVRFRQGQVHRLRQQGQGFGILIGIVATRAAFCRDLDGEFLRCPASPRRSEPVIVSTTVVSTAGRVTLPSFVMTSWLELTMDSAAPLAPLAGMEKSSRTVAGISMAFKSACSRSCTL